MQRKSEVREGAGRTTRTARRAGTLLLAAMAAFVARGQVTVQEIDDPSTGIRWVLSPDGIRPGGPGRWTRMGAPGAGTLRAPHRALVIRAGDLLIVEEHTAVADARLEAVALASAPSGAEFRARLKIGGKVVDAVALGPGRAVFAEEREEWR